jgi:hypothetical protein
MGQLISLNISKRTSGVKVDTFSPEKEFGFDVNDIVTPIRARQSGDLYFTTRQLKGNTPSSRIAGSTEYETTDSFSDVKAKSTSLLLLTVVRRRNVDVSNESYIFVAVRISENLKEVTPGGNTIFFYQEDGDPELVEYEVLESIDDIILQLNPVPVPENELIEITYAEAVTMAAGSEFIPGHHYKITDRADLGLILFADSENQLSLEGEGIFLNPDFDGNGDYSGVEDITGVPVGEPLGVWYTLDESGYADGDIVFWNGLHYQLVNSTAVDGSDPSTNTAAYTLLPKTASNVGYIKETDFIMFRFSGDQIIYRADKRFNEIYVNIENFQWGNNEARGVKDYYGSISCINQRGTISKVFNSSSGGINFTNKHSGSLVSSDFNNQSQVTFDGTGAHEGLSFSQDYTITISGSLSYSDNKISTVYSNFPGELNMSTDFAAGVLTIPTTLNYVGNFLLINNTGQTISKIVNLPKPHEVFFTPEAGLQQTFSHTAIGGAVANNLVSDAASANVIIGRTNGTDRIGYRYSGNLNVRTTIEKLA